MPAVTPDPSEERISHAAELSHIGTSMKKEVGTAPIFERKEIVDQIELALRLNHCVLLVGWHGCGKTACVEALVSRLENPPTAEKPWRDIIRTNPVKLQEGCYYAGDIENLLIKVFVNCSREKAILFIQNLNVALARHSNDPMDNLLNRLLCQWDKKKHMPIIATATPEGAELLRAFHRFEEVFQIIPVDPMDREVTLTALETLYPLMPSEIHSKLVDLCERFLPDQYFPGKALTLVKQLSQLPSTELSLEKVNSLIATNTGLNVEYIDETHPIFKDDLLSRFHETIVDQEEGVNALSNAVLRLKANLADLKRPIASLLFVGPPGVGKTEIAKALEKILFSKKKRLRYYSMAQYSGPEGLGKLVNGNITGEGWKMGTLIREAREYPFSIFLFDEIDHASPDVRNALFQLLDEGRLIDNTGNVASFTSSIVIMTTNLGAEKLQTKPQESNSEQKQQDATTIRRVPKAVLDLLKTELSAAFIDRTEVIPFFPLSPDALGKIAEIDLRGLQVDNRLLRRGILLEWIQDDPGPIPFLGKTVSASKEGARHVHQAIIDQVINPLAAYLSEHPDFRDQTVTLQVVSNEIKLLA